MNKNLICFGGGLALGIAGTYLYLKDYYNKLIDSETEKVREYYEKAKNAENSLIEDELCKDIEESEQPFESSLSGKNGVKNSIAEPNYKEIVEKLNYNQFSTVPKSDNIVESNSENEPEGPYPISVELYSETAGRFETQPVTYFIEDEVIMYTNTEELMDDPGKLLGYDNLADLRNNDELEEMYIRNEYMGIDFYVLKDGGSYEEYLAE